MHYRAVGKRCAVCLDTLKLSMPKEHVLATLDSMGFKVIDVDLIRYARECIGTSHYRRGARPGQAPAVVDCSSFVKWLYGLCGIWLPRRSIQQREVGAVVDPRHIRSGDLVFVKGAFDWYYDNPADGVGHVGIATGEGTVIHACDSSVNVIESPYERFVGRLSLRGVRRYIPIDHEVITLESPDTRDIEISDDFRWIILQTLPK